MFRGGYDIVPIEAKARTTRTAETRLVDLGHAALCQVVPEAITEIVRSTPRSAESHPHLQDNYVMTDHGAGVSIDNMTPYAGYVAQEPVNAHGARVAAHHSRELRAALDAMPEDIRQRLAAVLPKLYAQL